MVFTQNALIKFIETMVLPTLAATKSMRRTAKTPNLANGVTSSVWGPQDSQLALVFVSGRAGEHARFVIKNTRFILATTPSRRSEF